MLRGDAKAPSAVALMRSRFTAFFLDDVPYLERTWHPTTRPPALGLDPNQQWTHLEILGTHKGGPLDSDGSVEFRAHYRYGKQRGSLHENSRFVKEHGRWLYVDGVIGD
ncbi:UPF0225 protein [Hoyosella rhizosphaerae]|uniref:UPF0225 protein n=1 Tax=Hoyosella rhizosphaerae TaxID=1755582 RepID=A0A916UIE0_9ACTN|nr:UPF0225 protein [Hoyosella rhizosphaerae]